MARKLKKEELLSVEEMEKVKLAEEIRQLKRPLYRNPSFHTSMAAVYITILGLVATWSTCFLETRERRLVRKMKGSFTLETQFKAMSIR